MKVKPKKTRHVESGRERERSDAYTLVVLSLTGSAYTTRPNCAINAAKSSAVVSNGTLRTKTVCPSFASSVRTSSRGFARAISSRWPASKRPCAQHQVCARAHCVRVCVCARGWKGEQRSKKEIKTLAGKQMNTWFRCCFLTPHQPAPFRGTCLRQRDQRSAQTRAPLRPLSRGRAGCGSSASPQRHQRASPAHASWHRVECHCKRRCANGGCNCGQSLQHRPEHSKGTLCKSKKKK